MFFYSRIIPAPVPSIVIKSPSCFNLSTFFFTSDLKSSRNHLKKMSLISPADLDLSVTFGFMLLLCLNTGLSGSRGSLLRFLPTPSLLTPYRTKGVHQQSSVYPCAKVLAWWWGGHFRCLVHTFPESCKSLWNPRAATAQWKLEAQFHLLREASSVPEWVPPTYTSSVIWSLLHG